MEKPARKVKLKTVDPVRSLQKYGVFNDDNG